MARLNMDVPPAQYCGTEDKADWLLNRFLNKVDKDPEDFVGMDTETTALKIPLKPKADGRPSKTDPLDWMNDTVTFWSLAAQFEHDERWTIPGTLLWKFIPLFENKKTLFGTWNGKYDAHVLYNSGVYAMSSRYVDGLAMANLADENLQGGLGLKDVCAKNNPFFVPTHVFDADRGTLWQDLLASGAIPYWHAIPMTKYKDLFPDKDPDGNKIVEYEYSLINLHKHFPDKVSDYASLDAHAARLMCEHLRAILMQLIIPLDGDDYITMWDYFVDMEIPITKILWQMERHGIRISEQYFESLLTPLDNEIRAIEKEIFREAKWPINPKSPPQLRKLFFGSPQDDPPGLGLQPTKKTKGGKSLPAPSTDESVLETLAAQGVEVAKLILRHRSISKTRSTYVMGCLKLTRHFGDGRIHPEFKQFGARTGRFSTKTPNCCVDNTEVLTKRGWVPFPKLKNREHVAQWHEDGTISFVVPKRVIREQYTGDVYYYASTQVDLGVTPDHRCPVIMRSGRLDVASGRHIPSDRMYLHAGVYQGGGKHWTEPELTIICATQADAYWHDGGYEFTFKKKRKIDRLQWALSTHPEHPPYTKTVKGNGTTRFRIKAGPYVRNLRTLLGDDKSYGKWILDFDRDTLDRFCEEVHFWDGSWERQSMYASSVKSNSDWVQIALSLSGRRAKLREYRNGNPNAKVSHQVDVSRRNYSWTTNLEKRKEHYDGRVYCVEVPTGYFLVRRNGKVSVTGNSQNIPRPDTDEFGIRKAFIAPEGKNLLVRDYGQLEMRIMAHMSQDKGMIEAIRNGMDLHCFAVEKMFGIPYDEVKGAKKRADIVKYDELTDFEKDCLLKRQQCKNTGFAIIYGAGPPRVAVMLGITKQEAQDIIELYFEAFPGVRDFMENTIEFCSINGYVTTLVGRRRRLKDINSHTFIKRSHAEREATNGPIQGSAADIVKAAMINIAEDDECKRLGLILVNQVHDELIAECPESTSEKAMDRMQWLMEFPFNGEPALCVPTPTDGKIVKCHADAK